ncbi:hypothetical protein AB6A40_009949 [Gnathostoma spinigerum]|uniref:VWFC domain-containing protein n=1 Tax=Gnathostoma spinigerum TaxID=75299 RepID=A0ABD6ETE0_9BILA
MRIADSALDCRLSDAETIPPGFMWVTNDCRQCVCSEGQVRCSKKKCEPRDCLSENPSVPGKMIECPENQHCIVAKGDECLKGACGILRGQCLSWNQLEKNRYRVICKKDSRNSRRCSRIFLEFDFDALPENTSTDDVCYQLLMNAIALNEIDTGFDCMKTAKTVVQVDIISLKFTSDARIIKNLLKNRFINRQVSGTILNAVFQFGELNHLGQLDWTQTVSGNNQKNTNDWPTDGQVLTGFSLMLILAFLLISVWLWVKPSSKCVAIHRHHPAPISARCVESNIYTTKPIIRFESVETPMLLSSVCSRPRGSASSKDSFEYDEISKQKYENERNARILEENRCLKDRCWKNSLKSTTKSADVNPCESMAPLFTRPLSCVSHSLPRDERPVFALSVI